MINVTDTAHQTTNEVYFIPLLDSITLHELVAILQMTVFQGPGEENGVYSEMPPELKRHFIVVPKARDK